MPRSIRRWPMASAYSAMLERFVPRLEEILYNKLERLESKVARHEMRHGLPMARSSKAKQRPRCTVNIDLNVGRPSVIVLGSRLDSDKLYCRALIQRVAAVIRIKLASAYCRNEGDSSRKS